MSNSRVFSNSVVVANQTETVNNAYFRGVYCENYTYTISGVSENGFKNSLKGKLLSSETRQIAKYGDFRVIRTTYYVIDE
jgi:hypothetical protein